MPRRLTVLGSEKNHRPMMLIIIITTSIDIRHKNKEKEGKVGFYLVEWDK